MHTKRECLIGIGGGDSDLGAGKPSPINRRVGPDLGIIVNLYIPKLRHLVVSPVLHFVTKTVRPNHPDSFFLYTIFVPCPNPGTTS